MSGYGVLDTVTKGGVLESSSLTTIRELCNARKLGDQSKENYTDVLLGDKSLHIDGNIRLFPPLQQFGHRRVQRSLLQGDLHLTTCCNEASVCPLDCMKMAMNEDGPVCATKTNQGVVKSLTRSYQTKLNDELSGSYTDMQEQQQKYSNSHSFGNLTRLVPLEKVGVAQKESHDHSKFDIYQKEQKEEEHGMVNSSTVFGEVLTDDLLRLWTGYEDIKSVLSAEFRVDAVKVSGVDSLSSRMPCLNSLKLTNSNIPQIRMLGTRFMNLKRLWIGSSHVQNLRGIASCAPILEELYASFNSVYDITPLLDLCETLEVVDLEGNAISDIESLLNSLSLLGKVKYLTLDGNPAVMCSKSLVKATDCETEDSRATMDSFRERVLSVMPNLQYLDDIGVTINTATTSFNNVEEKEMSVNDVNYSKRSCTHVDPLSVSLHDEYMFLQHCIRECGFDALEAAVAEETSAVCSRPQSSFSFSRRRSCPSPSIRLAPAGGFSNSQTTNCVTCVPNSISKGSVRGGNIAISSASSCLTSSGISGSVVAGTTVNTRHRLPPLQPAKVLGCAINKSNGNGGSSGGKKNTSDKAYLSLNNTSASPFVKGIDVIERSLQRDDIHMFTATNPSISPAKDILDTPLFDDDEEYWEEYKQNFMRRIDSRRAGVQHWAKYVSGESAFSSQGDRESQGLSALSRSTYTRTTSASSDPAALFNHPTLQAPTFVVEEGGGNKKSTIGLSKDDGEKEDEGEWWQELLRSVVQSRMQTARAALDEEYLHNDD